MGLTILTGSRLAVASEMRTNLFLAVPKSDMHLLIPDFLEHAEIPLGDQTVPGPFNAQIKQAVAKFDSKLNQLTFGNQGEIEGFLQVQNLIITAASLHVDTVVEQIVNGTIIRVHIKADCTGVTLTARKSVDVLLKGQVSGSPFDIVIQSATWPPQTDLWSFQAQQCVAPNNFPALVEQKINESWGSPDAINASLLQEINARLFTWVTANRKWSRELPGQLTVHGEILEMIPQANEWIFLVNAVFDSHRTCLPWKKSPRFDLALQDSPEGVELRISQAAIFSLLNCMQDLKTFNHAINTRQIPAFQNLIGNAAAKWFVWPDLNRYPSTAEFMLRSRGAGQLKATLQSSQETQAGHVVNYSLSSNILTLMRYIRSGQEEPYVQFFSPVSGIAQFSAAAGRIVFKWASAVNLNMQYAFDLPASVISDRRIDTKKIQPILAEEFGRMTFGFVLPSLKLGEKNDLHFHDFNDRNGAIRLYGTVVPVVP